MGGVGTGSSFIANYDALDSYKLNMRVVHDVNDPNLAAEFFGKSMRLPVFAAPVAGTSFNMGGKLSEREYISAVISGCKAAGIYPMVGDGAVDTLFTDNLEIVREFGGWGIGIIKPWEIEIVREKLKLAKMAGTAAVGMDIDAAGLTTLSLLGKPVGPKSFLQLKEIVESTDLPFILKGIMTVKDAEIAVETGASAIVVSNHGGRVLDHTPGVAEILPEIADRVKGRITILADGGVRTGVDILKMLALGADAVLIGRPFVIAAFGGGSEGVRLYVDKLYNELRTAMILTGSADVKSIDNSVIY
jgi:isopentenyl diphosphate isomerase/L-lactate dehydrogenase-like FMN-dependent dehydrogenase